MSSAVDSQAHDTQDTAVTSDIVDLGGEGPGDAPSEGPGDARGCQGCLIDAICYAAGAANPKDACQACDPGFSPSRWGVASGCVMTLAGTGVAGFADGKAKTAQFDYPFGIALDSQERVIVADAHNHRIRRVDPATGDVMTLAGDGTAGYRDGPAATARFNRPSSVAVSASGMIYITDWQNNRIRTLSASGAVGTLAGDGTTGFRDGPAASARFHAPMGVAIDQQGDLLVADEGNHRIRKITLSSGIVSTLAGDGTAGYRDGVAASARFTEPRGVAVRSDKAVIVGDWGGHVLRTISQGQVTTLAGTGVKGHKDGPALQAMFVAPHGLAMTSADQVYVGDCAGHALRFVAGGQVTTIAGTGASGANNGKLATATFGGVGGVALGSGGRIYIADTDGHLIRVLKR